MSKKVHQRIYGPYKTDTTMYLEASPDTPDINYRANISSYPARAQTNWGDRELEDGITHVLTKPEHHFLNINVIFLSKKTATLTLVFTGPHGSETKTIEVAAEQDKETHLVAIDIITSA